MESKHILTLKFSHDVSRNMTSHELTQIELNRISEAFILAIRAHKGSYRGDGVPYVSHPIRIALHALNLGMSSDTVIAAVLHDVVEDTDTPLSEIRDKFGEGVESMVKALTKSPRGTPNRTQIYQEQLLEGPIEARRIKLLDIQDNLSDVDVYLGEDAAREYRLSREALAAVLEASLEHI